MRRGAAAQVHGPGRRSIIARLEELTKGALVRGVAPDAAVTVVDVTWHGTQAITLTYTTADGQPASRLLFRDDEPSLTLAEAGRPWAFDADGDAFRLASEANRIRVTRPGPDRLYADEEAPVRQHGGTFMR